MGRVSAAAIAVITAIGVAGPAHADSDDDAFLKAMHTHGITNTDGDQGLIHLAHVICTALGNGASMNSVVDEAQLYANYSSSPDNARVLVQSSAAAYCPQYIQ